MHLLLQLMFLLSHWGVTCLWLILEFFYRQSGDNWQHCSQLFTLTYDLWPVSPNLTISGDHWVTLCVYCQISSPVFKETSNCSDQHLYNKSTVRVVVNAHRKYQYNRAAFFSFSSVNQTQKQHRCCWRIVTTKAKSKASQPWLACALYLLVSSAAADALVSLIIMTGFITEKWYAVLAGKFELFMLLLNNRHE